jgi:predicted membrane GTPase involved in stress response
VTPKAIRMRKRVLSAGDRIKLRKRDAAVPA